MKKDRNSFFSEYNMNAYNTMQPMMQQPYMMPNQVSSQSSFYSGPVVDQNMIANQNTYTENIDSRISKLERQINRLESRINKLESEISTNSSSFHTETDTVYKNNMYMV